MSDKAWNLFLQRLHENDSSFNEIKGSPDSVLQGILKDFGFNNLQQGQILTRFQQEISTPSSLPAQMKPVAATATPPQTPPQPSEVKVWLESLKLETYEAGLKDQGIVKMNDLLELTENKMDDIFSKVHIPLGHKKRIQRAIIGMKESGEIPQSSYLNMSEAAENKYDNEDENKDENEEKEEDNIIIPKNASKEGPSVYISPRAAAEQASSGGFKFAEKSAPNPPSKPASLSNQPSSTNQPSSANQPSSSNQQGQKHENEMEVTISIPLGLVGYVVGGREKYNLLKIKSETGAKIEREKQGKETDPHVRFMISGSNMAVFQAKKALIDILEDAKRKSLVMYVLSVVVGTVIGKGGENIRSIQAACDVQIRLEPDENREYKTTAVHRVDIIPIGDRGDLQKAKKKVIASEFNDLKTYFDMKDETHHVSYFSHFPDQFLAFTIGKDGARLRHLMHISETVIETCEEQEGTYFLITGFPAGVIKAKKALSYVAEEFSEEGKQPRFV